MNKIKIYPKMPNQVGSAGGVIMTNRSMDKIIPVRHNTPGNIILVHGVNDLGASYSAVESGLCEGISKRISGELVPAKYKIPGDEDRKRIIDDPDAFFFKRTTSDKTLSPVIPFYWGYREVTDKVQLNAKLSRGQALDRFGNRLDKGFSKGGGPFANATSTLPDMWNKGKWSVGGMLDKGQGDATHPVLDNPGRLYMILAARRLAALISMIRDYDEDETVSVVAHSQGCLITLLAQAFLMDPLMKKVQKNARPADTLILTHPPYSLSDDMRYVVEVIDRYSDGDESMAQRYNVIKGTQTTNARIQTLANIVRGIYSAKHCTPDISDLTDAGKHFGAVGKGWSANDDRDNRGKVYLYFCPEDMTVALENVKGIGWQGIPTVQASAPTNGRSRTLYRPLGALGEGFFQRVFTAKRRPDPVTGRAVMVVPKDSPFYFLLRHPNENESSHTAVSDNFLSRKFVRSTLDRTSRSKIGIDDEETRNQGIRTINGEPLNNPVEASMFEGAITDFKGRPGGSERVDPVDSAIAITSQFGLINVWQVIDYPTISNTLLGQDTVPSPFPSVYSGEVVPAHYLMQPVQFMFNKDKKPDMQSEILAVFACSSSLPTFYPTEPQKILLKRTETWNEARLRWQNTIVPRSFHGAIFGSQANHSNVTAYDIAIGCGKATSDPSFYLYLCSVADWRLEDSHTPRRKNVEKWIDFQKKHSVYFSVEPAWRRELIQGNMNYYSSGVLPGILPLPPEGFPIDVISEIKK